MNVINKKIDELRKDLEERLRKCKCCDDCNNDCNGSCCGKCELGEDVCNCCADCGDDCNGSCCDDCKIGGKDKLKKAKEDLEEEFAFVFNIQDYFDNQIMPEFKRLLGGSSGGTSSSGSSAPTFEITLFDYTHTISFSFLDSHIKTVRDIITAVLYAGFFFRKFRALPGFIGSIPRG